MFRTASLPARCGLTVLSGILYALAFPPLGWRWLIAPGIVGLLLSLQGLQGSRARGMGFLHGMVAYGVGLPWIWLLFGPFAVALFTVANWCGWEFIRAELFPLKFPWMTPGLACGPGTFLSVCGVHGVSAFVMFACAFLLVRPWRCLAISALLLFAHTSSNRISVFFEPGASENIRVAGLQYEDVSLQHFISLMTAHSEPLRCLYRPSTARSARRSASTAITKPLCAA